MTASATANKAHLLDQLTLARNVTAASDPVTKISHNRVLSFTILAAVGLILLVIFALWAYNGNNLVASEPSPSTSQVERADSKAFQNGPTPPLISPKVSVEAMGYVVARQIATVGTDTMGELMEVHFEEGQSVKAGDILARMKDHKQRGQYQLARSQKEQAQASIELTTVTLVGARKAYDRSSTLAVQGLISTAALEASQQALDQATAQLLIAHRQVRVADKRVQLAYIALENTIIRAPFTGVVIHKTAQVGEIVSPMSAGGFTRTGIGTIVNMASLEIGVDISENLINHVVPSQPVEISLNAYPNSTYKGHVIAVIPTADRNKATIRVRVGIDTLNSRFLPQMSVRVVFMEQSGQGDHPLG